MDNSRSYKVSVITAVYNAEDYLEETIESVINQTIGFENVQMILINDGSMDGSKEICDKYMAEYPENILAVHKENGGVSSARNEAFKYVKGEYVNFLDSDDKLEENALEVMYEYLEENKEWIDLVAIPLKFFGARGGDHPLNYKFKKTRIVDLRKEYNYIQLSLSATMVKSECFNRRRFDEKLSYAEDAQLAVDILLDKMRYGVIKETSYLYRKSETGGSAIDNGRNKSVYYVPYIERFILYSLENALTKREYIPQFVQYTCMYDLQWRLNQNPLVNKGILNEEEEEKYKALIVKALQYIDNNIILEQKNIGNNYKMAILELKEENKGKRELVAYPDDYKICIKDVVSASISSYAMFFEFINISSKQIEIEGYVRYFAELEDIKIIFKSESEENVSMEYTAELFEREEKCTFCVDKVVTKATGFRFSINRDEMMDEVELQLCLRYKNNDVICKNILFGKFFPLSKQMKNSYLYREGILLTYYENKIKLLKTSQKRVVKKCEREFQKEMLSKKDRMVFRGWIARNIYHVLKRFKRKELWLISDRLKKADDNGEAFFTYMNTIGKNEDIDTYFVLDKDSEDYERLCKIGKVVPYHSTKHKILSLLCDKVISAQADDYVFNRFFDLAYLYKDILHQQKFVFLQHGIIKDNLSRWLAKANKNISLFVTTTPMEYQSVLDYAYYYTEKQVKCTGLPRYDYLYGSLEDKKVITFMPTWRSYLAGKFDVHTDSRVLKSGFEESTYCRMYKQVFSDNRLYEAAYKYNYTIELMLHPTMPRECIEYFNCKDSVKILEKNTRYRELYAESKLIITDYSSAVFDFAYLRKPVLYYQQDADEFFSGNHTYDKGYFDYERDGFGEVEYTAEELVSRIIEYMKNDCQLKEVYRERIEKTFPYHDKDNCKRVYEEIVKLK